MPYIPHTDDDIKRMLDTIGVDSLDQLFDEIPAALRSGTLQSVPEGSGEMEVMQLMQQRAAQDGNNLCFLGAGAYEHHIPAAVWDLVSRGEFMTAYTPYQAEASQGTLQVIYEYQSMMAHLTGMDVSNASLYDGASAMAEASLMAIRANRKSKSKKVLVPTNSHPFYRSTTYNIVHNQHIELVELPFDHETGQIDSSALNEYEGQDFAAMVIQQPNFFGVLEDVHELSDWAHAQGMLVIAVVNPTSLAVLTPPGEWGERGADIVVGDGQPLGVPLSSGGPYFGFMCCQQSIVRQMPGRVIGRTVDLEGHPGFTLTLQAREQHIRRSKATSNICTNQGLAMTAATIYLSLMGAEGLARVASASHGNTRKLVEKLTTLSGVKPKFNSAFFHEVVIELPRPVNEVLEKMAAEKIQAGISLAPWYGDLENCLLLCVTETKSDDDLNRYVQQLSKALG